LYDLICRRKRLPEKVVREMIFKLLSAIEYLHERYGSISVAFIIVLINACIMIVDIISISSYYSINAIHSLMYVCLCVCI